MPRKVNRTTKDALTAAKCRLRRRPPQYSPWWDLTTSIYLVYLKVTLTNNLFQGQTLVAHWIFSAEKLIWSVGFFLLSVRADRRTIIRTFITLRHLQIQLTQSVTTWNITVMILIFPMTSSIPTYRPPLRHRSWVYVMTSLETDSTGIDDAIGN